MVCKFQSIGTLRSSSGVDAWNEKQASYISGIGRGTLRLNVVALCAAGASADPDDQSEGSFFLWQGVSSDDAGRLCPDIPAGTREDQCAGARRYVAAVRDAQPAMHRSSASAPAGCT